jgi:hypothetical protein
VSGGFNSCPTAEAFGFLVIALCVTERLLCLKAKMSSSGGRVIPGFMIQGSEAHCLTRCEIVFNDLDVCSYPRRRPIIAQEPMMATVNQMIPLSGQPKRFSFHTETSMETTQVKPRNIIVHRLKAIIVSQGSTGPTCSWRASVSLTSVGLVAAYRVLGLVRLPYQSRLEVVL